MKPPEKIKMDPNEIEALITRVETNCLRQGDALIIRAMAEMV